MSKKLMGPQGERHPTKWKLHLIDICGGREWIKQAPKSGCDTNRRDATKWTIHLDKQSYLITETNEG